MVTQPGMLEGLCYGDATLGVKGEQTSDEVLGLPRHTCPVLVREGIASVGNLILEGVFCDLTGEGRVASQPAGRRRGHSPSSAHMIPLTLCTLHSARMIPLTLCAHVHTSSHDPTNPVHTAFSSHDPTNPVHPAFSSHDVQYSAHTPEVHSFAVPPGPSRLEHLGG